MSASTSKRRAKARDWAALASAIRAEDEEAQALFPHGKWRHTGDGDGYLRALQEALERRKLAPLLTMLDNGCPLSDLLLPTLAEVIRDIKQGKFVGQPKATTYNDDEFIRGAFNRLSGLGEPKIKIYQQLAGLLNVSELTIQRSLQRTKSST